MTCRRKQTHGYPESQLVTRKFSSTYTIVVITSPSGYNWCHGGTSMSNATPVLQILICEIHSFACCKLGWSQSISNPVQVGDCRRLQLGFEYKPNSIYIVGCTLSMQRTLTKSPWSKFLEKKWRHIFCREISSIHSEQPSTKTCNARYMTC